MGGQPGKNEDAFLEQGQGGGGDRIVAAGGGGDDDRVSRMAAASYGSGAVSSDDSLFSSTSSLTDDEDDDDATSPPEGGRKWPSSSSSSSDSMQLEGGGGPLYELSPLLASLPIRTGLSKYYQGRSESFTSLSDVKCVEDLAKKTIPYTSRMKARRYHGAAGTVVNRQSDSRYAPALRSKTIAKNTPRYSTNLLLSRARSTGPFQGSAKSPSYQSKKDV